MPDVVSAFLAGIGLGLLEDTFAEHDIDEVTLFELDENDLKKMGVRMGPRRKLLAALRDAAASRPPPATARAAAPPDDGLAGLGVRALKALAAERGVDISRCCEKSEIVALLRAAPPAPAPAPAPEPAAPPTTTSAAPPPPRPPPTPPVVPTPAAPPSTMGSAFGASLAGNPKASLRRATTAARSAPLDSQWTKCLKNAAKANNGKRLSKDQSKQLKELWDERVIKAKKDAVRPAPTPPRAEPPAPEPALLTHLHDLGLERFAPALARAGVATVADLLRVAGDAKRLRDLADPESGTRLLPVGPYSKLKASLERLRDEAPRPVSPPPPVEAPKPKKKEKRPAAPTTPAEHEHENTIKQLRKANEKLRADAANAYKVKETKLLRRVAEQEQTIKQLRKSNAAATKAKKDNKEYQLALDALSTKANDSDALAAENARLRDENATLRDQNAALREDVWRPGARVEAAEAEAAKLRDRLGLRLQEAAKLKAENVELHREVAMLRAGVLCSLQGADTAGRKLFQERVGEIFAELTAAGTAPNEAAAAALRRATAERAAQTVTPDGGAPHRMIYDDETDSELEGYA